jgi:hypothetical protein
VHKVLKILILLFFALAAVGVLYYIFGFPWLHPAPETKRLSELLIENNVRGAVVQQLIYPNLSRIYLITPDGASKHLFSFKIKDYGDIFSPKFHYAEIVPGPFDIDLSPDKTFLRYPTKAGYRGDEFFELSPFIETKDTPSTSYLRSRGEYIIQFLRLLYREANSISPNGRWVAYETFPSIYGYDDPYPQNKLLLFNDFENLNTRELSNNKIGKTIFASSVCDRIWFPDSSYLLLIECEGSSRTDFWLYSLSDDSLTPFPYKPEFSLDYGKYPASYEFIDVLGSPDHPILIISRHDQGEYALTFDETRRQTEQKLFDSSIKIVGFIP